MKDGNCSNQKAYILSTEGRTNCVKAVDKGQVIALESLSNVFQAYTTFQALASIINVQDSIRLHAIAFGYVRIPSRNVIACSLCVAALDSIKLRPGTVLARRCITSLIE